MREEDLFGNVAWGDGWGQLMGRQAGRQAGTMCEGGGDRAMVEKEIKGGRNGKEMVTHITLLQGGQAGG